MTGGASASSYTRGRSSLGHIYGLQGGGGGGGSGSGGGRGDNMRRTPSTSAIYETLRRSRELRESLSRPSSRMSIDNSQDRIRDSVRRKYREKRKTDLTLFLQDTQYFSDSEHQMLSTSYSQRQEMRRFRNRTMSGMDPSSALAMGRAGSALGHHHGGLSSSSGVGLSSGLDHFLSQRPSSATGLRSITPSFGGAGVATGDAKDNGQSFVDFNPAGGRGLF